MAQERQSGIRSGPWGRFDAGAELDYTGQGQSRQQPHPVAMSRDFADSDLPLRRTDFLAAQRANHLNTLILIVLLLELGAVTGYLLGLMADAYASEAASFDAFAMNPIALSVAAIFLGLGLIAVLVTFFAGDRVVIGLTGAHEVSSRDELVLHNIVDEIAIASGLPKPRVVVIETGAMNAFATGMKPERAAIGITRGMLESMTRDELQGVVGHEMAHIANLDTRYMTAVGILVGLIALVADGIRNWVYYGGLNRSGRRRGKGAGALSVVVIVFSILAPIAATLVRFAVSRQREYLADATSVRFTRNPRGLISALRKLERAAKPFKGANRATQHMFIVNPFRNFDNTRSALFATHPPLIDRVERLQNLGAI